MKTRLQKTGESLQKYAPEIERLANLAFSDYPANVREIISLQYFVDGLKNPEGYRNGRCSRSKICPVICPKIGGRQSSQSQRSLLHQRS
ncbi:hypothetical protein TNCV_2624861 [Trichonephila clavipes]|nr:hypothetical protein TNCV_2624861 [Trichonephila clavipes]